MYAYSDNSHNYRPFSALLPHYLPQKLKCHVVLALHTK